MEVRGVERRHCEARGKDWSCGVVYTLDTCGVLGSDSIASSQVVAEALLYARAHGGGVVQVGSFARRDCLLGLLNKEYGLSNARPRQ
jgi:hypothetical protein